MSDPPATWLSHLHANYPHSSWSYSWGRQPSDAFPYMGTDHAFNPMQWGDFNFAHGDNQGPLDTLRNDLQSNPKPVSLMGFNEPDGAKQANMTVATAIQRWPRLLAMDAPLVSPGPVNAPIPWIDDFYQQVGQLGYRVDYTSVHWYKAPSADALINKLQEIHTRYGRPIWLTEFSAVRWEGGATWTHADNYNFLAEFLWRAESLPYLRRYSLFNFREGAGGDNQSANDPPEAPRSNAIRADGSLTPFGELYAGWDGVTSVVNHKAYHLHNHGQYQRVRNGGGNLAETTPPEDSGPGTQWFLVPGSTAGTLHILSTRDGRPLRFFDGGNVSFGTAGQDNPAVEWRLAADAHGRYFIEHPATNKRLKNNGNGTYGMVAITNSGDDIKWRFIHPLEPVTTIHPFATFDGWAAQFLNHLPPEDRTPTADPDADGLPNLLEHVFLTDPAAPDGNPFQIENVATSTITLTFPWNWRATGHTWQLRHGPDLSNPAAWPVVDPGNIEKVRVGGIDRIRVTPAMAYPTRGFYILEVIEN